MVAQTELPGAHQLPAPLTSFIGRERELADVCALLLRNDVRLLTLTGPGGVGKTRLALAAATAMTGRFESGARFVPLAAVQDHRLVGPTLAGAVGVPEVEPSGFASQVRAAAGDLEALLLVDNIEHLLAAAPVLAELLDACPYLTLLVTSRERLRLSGERDFPVAPLPVPDPEQSPSPEQVAAAPGVRLFVGRAQEMDPSFNLSDANAAAVAAICHRLDGLPLALELAAARSPHLTPAALLARLARRLPLLTTGPRDAPARLRTMRDAIAWSYDLLSPDEQALFRRLSVFTGGFTLEAAEAVRGEWVIGEGGWGGAGELSPIPHDPSPVVLDGISSLVDKSLVRRADSAGADPRFGMLETIRELGLETLASVGEETDAGAAHAKYFKYLAAQIGVRGPEDTELFDRTESELPNLRAAFAWFTAYEPGAALELAAALGRFWFRTGRHREGRNWLERALADNLDADPLLRSASFCSLGDLLRELGERSESERAFTAARELSHTYGDRLGEATALTGLAALANDVSDFASQKPLIEAAVALWRETGDRAGLAQALHHLAWAEAGFGNFASAHAHLREALEHARTSGDNRWTARCLSSIGTMLIQEHQFGPARPYLEEGLAVARAGRNRHEISVLLTDLAMLTIVLDDLPAARAHVAECVALLRESGRRRIGVFALEGAGVLAELSGQNELAVGLVASVQSIRAEIGIPVDKESGLAPGLSEGVVEAMRTLSRLVVASAAVERPWSFDEALREAWEFASAPSHSEPGAVNEPVAGRYGLSPREVDVLRLVVGGRTDQAIADELFISRRTASKHVAAILAKLDAASRAEAAVRAVRDGLVPS